MPHTVKLLNVPHYYQGTFDSLCVYYTGAMMLAALFPEYGPRFGASPNRKVSPRMSRDPLIAMHRPSGDGRNDPRTLARWFYLGEYVGETVRTLNRIVTEDGNVAPFVSEDRNRVDGTFEWITENIDDGLPVMLGWNTEDYGCHAVLVVGYRRGRENWLTVNNPGGLTEVNWNSLRGQAEERFNVGYCETGHRGPRPMKSVTRGENETESTEVLQWTPKPDGTGGMWVNIDEIWGNRG